MKSLPQRYPRIYALLKRFEFSPAKAIEILIDAKRGDPHAKLYVQLAASARPYIKRGQS